MCDDNWLPGNLFGGYDMMMHRENVYVFGCADSEFLPMIILGASPETPLIKGAISASCGMFIDSNFNSLIPDFPFQI